MTFVHHMIGKIPPLSRLRSVASSPVIKLSYVIGAAGVTLAPFSPTSC
jgi:hypothetical protein